MKVHKSEDEKHMFWSNEEIEETFNHDDSDVIGGGLNYDEISWWHENEPFLGYI